jgi:hypothetical protein
VRSCSRSAPGWISSNSRRCRPACRLCVWSSLGSPRPWSSKLLSPYARCTVTCPPISSSSAWRVGGRSGCGRRANGASACSALVGSRKRHSARVTQPRTAAEAVIANLQPPTRRADGASGRARPGLLAALAALAAGLSHAAAANYRHPAAQRHPAAARRRGEAVRWGCEHDGWSAQARPDRPAHSGDIAAKRADHESGAGRCSRPIGEPLPRARQAAGEGRLHQRVWR